MKYLKLMLAVALVVVVQGAITLSAEETEPVYISSNVTETAPSGSFEITVDLSTITDNISSVDLTTSTVLPASFSNKATVNGNVATFVAVDLTSPTVKAYYAVPSATTVEKVDVQVRITLTNGNYYEQIVSVSIKANANPGSGTPSINMPSISNANSNNNTKYLGSDNNYLDSLVINGIDYYPEFQPTNRTYFVTVSSETTKITITAKTADSNATCTIYGNTNLQEGQNKVLITITSENGETRTYRIYVTKEAE